VEKSFDGLRMTGYLLNLRFLLIVEMTKLSLRSVTLREINLFRACRFRLHGNDRKKKIFSACSAPSALKRPLIFYRYSQSRCITDDKQRADRHGDGCHNGGDEGHHGQGDHDEVVDERDGDILADGGDRFF